MFDITAVVSSFIFEGDYSTQFLLLNYTSYFIGKPASLYDETNPDWAPSVKMDHENLTFPDMQQKRQKRVEKREVRKQASAAAQSLILLQHVDDGALSANPEQDLSVGTQTDIDSTLMEGISNELKDLRAENIELKQQAAVSELTLNNLEGKDDKVKYLTGLSSFVVLSTLFSYILPFLPKKQNRRHHFRWFS